MLKHYYFTQLPIGNEFTIDRHTWYIKTSSRTARLKADTTVVSYFNKLDSCYAAG